LARTSMSSQIRSEVNETKVDLSANSRRRIGIWHQVTTPASTGASLESLESTVVGCVPTDFRVI
jgi:hypothetical protein